MERQRAVVANLLRLEGYVGLLFAVCLGFFLANEQMAIGRWSAVTNGFLVSLLAMLIYGAWPLRAAVKLRRGESPLLAHAFSFALLVLWFPIGIFLAAYQLIVLNGFSSKSYQLEGH